MQSCTIAFTSFFSPVACNLRSTHANTVLFTHDDQVIPLCSLLWVMPTVRNSKRMTYDGFATKMRNPQVVWWLVFGCMLRRATVQDDDSTIRWLQTSETNLRQTRTSINVAIDSMLGTLDKKSGALRRDVASGRELPSPKEGESPQKCQSGPGSP